MALRRAIRHTAEGPLLLLALAGVMATVLPIWQWATTNQGGPYDRLMRLLLGPEQIACYVCFTWAVFILLTRAGELRRQRSAFELELLPSDEDLRILPEDARQWQRRANQLDQRRGGTLLGLLIDLALAKFSISRAPHEVGATVRETADLEMTRLVSSMAVVNYLAWAIPALGFVGTARGIGLALSVSPTMASDSIQLFLEQTTRSLAVTFDTTLVALSLSVVLMFFVHQQQRAEESLVVDAQQYCLEHLQGKLVVLDQPPVAASLLPTLPESTRRTALHSDRDFGHGLGGIE